MDISVKVYDVSGKETGKLKLKEEIFGAEYNEAVIHEVVTAQRNAKRLGTKSTLTRTEVRGGGIKPWRQKGTGRARQGSIRSPQWIKGGIVFAPKPRDFSQKVNKKVKDAALKSALSYKVSHGEFTVLEAIDIPPKTREMAKVLKNLKLDRNTLFVLPKDSGNAVTAAANIPFITTTASELLNVYDIVNNINLLTTKAAVKELEEALI